MSMILRHSGVVGEGVERTKVSGICDSPRNVRVGIIEMIAINGTCLRYEEKKADFELRSALNVDASDKWRCHG